MADFQAAYDQTTQDINNTLSTQLSSVLTWANIPGELQKVSSSAYGFAWGFSGSSVYTCQLPCSGNWQPVDLSKFDIGVVLDIATDDTNVYILVNSSSNIVILTNTADGRGVWNVVPVPFPASQIFSTHSYIWAQDSQNNKQKCPKPCTTTNWIAESENKVKITSSSSTSLYGKDSSGVGLKTDEVLQSGWSPIVGLLGTKVSSVLGQLDKTSVYAVDPTSKVLKCEGDCSTNAVSPVDTQGYTPLNLTADPGSKLLWLTAQTKGDLGNIFSRPDKPDYSTIMNTITPLDKQRDAVVTDVVKDYNQQTGVMTVNKQVSDIESFFKKIFGDQHKSTTNTKNASGHLQQLISDQQVTLDQINSVQPIISGFVYTLIAVVVIYLVGSILGSFIHWIAFLVLLGGIYLTINNGFSSSTLWTGLFKAA
uniref:Uncharacterized protein n=1 Tax=viral metagenome TaxID=1070528 RepID=A0A6C0KEH6_9ZZZZ